MKAESFVYFSPAHFFPLSFIASHLFSVVVVVTMVEFILPR